MVHLERKAILVIDPSDTSEYAHALRAVRRHFYEGRDWTYLKIELLDIQYLCTTQDNRLENYCGYHHLKMICRCKETGKRCEIEVSVRASMECCNTDFQKIDDWVLKTDFTYSPIFA